MNIFILDEDISKSAEYHVDKHVVKMILESAQLLSAACRISGLDAGYKLTHQHHPCTKWVCESLSNWMYLLDFSEALHLEWQYRFNHTKVHKSYEVITSLPAPDIKDIGLTQFALAMPQEFKTDNAVESYRNYYIHCKQHLAGWKNRDIPFWWK